MLPPTRSRAVSDLESALDQAAHLERSGALADALAVYSDASERQKRDPRAFRGAGRVLAALGRHAEAIEAYQQAIWIISRDAETRAAMACSAYALGRYKDAALHFRFALEADPAHFERHSEQEPLWLEVEARYSEYDEQIRRLLRRADPRDCLRFLELVPSLQAARSAARCCDGNLREHRDHLGLALVGAVLGAAVNVQPDESALRDGIHWARESLANAGDWAWFVEQLLRNCRRISALAADRVAKIVLSTDLEPGIARVCYGVAVEDSESHLAAVIALGRELLPILRADAVAAA